MLCICAWRGGRDAWLAATQLEGPRALQATEREDVIAMLNYVFRVAQGLPPSIATDWPHIFVAENFVAMILAVTPLERH